MQWEVDSFYKLQLTIHIARVILQTPWLNTFYWRIIDEELNWANKV